MAHMNMSIFDEDPEIFDRYTDSGMTWYEYKVHCCEKIDAERRLITRICDHKGLEGALRDAVCKLWLDQLGLLPPFYRWRTWPKRDVDTDTMVPIGCKLLESKEEHDDFWLSKTGESPDSINWEDYKAKGKARIDRLRHEALHKVAEYGYKEDIVEEASKNWCEFAGLLPDWYDWDDFGPPTPRRSSYTVETPQSRQISSLACRYHETIQSFRRRSQRSSQDSFDAYDWFEYRDRAKAQIDMTRLDMLKYLDHRGVDKDIAKQSGKSFCEQWALIPEWYEWKDFDESEVQEHTYGKRLAEGGYQPERVFTPEKWDRP